MNDRKYQKYPQVTKGRQIAYQFVVDGERTIYSTLYYSNVRGMTMKDGGQLTAMAKEIITSKVFGLPEYSSNNTAVMAGFYPPVIFLNSGASIHPEILDNPILDG